MPGMSMTSGGGGSAWLVLAEIALFWTAAIVHVLRLLAPRWLPDADPATDAGHAVMAAGMVFMVFPSAPAGVARMLAVGFAALAGWFALRAVRRPDRRPRSIAVAAGQAAMALMLGVVRPGSAVTMPAALVMLACAAVHARRWSHVHRMCVCSPGTERGRERVLVTLPHLGAVATTLAMAVLLGAA